MLEDARRLAERLRGVLDERMVVERAIGIVMSRSGVDEVQALARLTVLSQHEHVKLVQIARRLVDEAVATGPRDPAGLRCWAAPVDGYAGSSHPGPADASAPW